MTTAAESVRAILQEIIVQESEQDIVAPEAQDVISMMNKYMFMLDSQGISLGYTVVSDLGDTITIPPGAIMGMDMNVAIAVAGQFGVNVQGTTLTMARDGMSAMRKLGITIGEMSMPCTLPRGSGNEDPDGFSTTHFFPCEEDEVLTEQGGSILLENS